MTEARRGSESKSISALVVFGTRPELIKLAPLAEEMARRPSWIVWTCNTGQQRELTRAHLAEAGFEPDFDLDVMQDRQSLPATFSRIVAGLEPVIVETRPNLIVVQGDTTSAAAAAIAGFLLGVRVIHIEAGLRTPSLASPFPEEGFRRLISPLAWYNFAPTSKAGDNLRRECVGGKVAVVGNTGLDAVRTLSGTASAAAGIEKVRTVLVTVHRRERQRERLDNLFAAIRRLSDLEPALRFKVLVHPNPEISRRLRTKLAEAPNVELLPPLTHQQTIDALLDAWVVLTDSGGLQEEAAYLGRPTLVMRDETERVEALEAGVSRVVGIAADDVVSAFQDLLRDGSLYAGMRRRVDVFGDGLASRRILDILEGELWASSDGASTVAFPNRHPSALSAPSLHLGVETQQGPSRDCALPSSRERSGKHG